MRNGNLAGGVPGSESCGARAELHAVMFCYRNPQGKWATLMKKLDVVQNGTVHVVPKYAFREMGLE